MGYRGQYYASTDKISGSASAQNLASLENPQGSGVLGLLMGVEVKGVASVVSTSLFLYKFGRTTGLPTGSTQPAIEQAITTAQGGTAAACLVRSAPTATLVSALPWSGMPDVGVGSLISGALVFPRFVADAYRARDEADALQLGAGEAVLVTADANLVTWTHVVRFIWREHTL